jgi:lipoprotein-anchoring transpeptidase ErfK/SrfK
MNGHGIILRLVCSFAVALTALISASSTARADIVIAIDTAAQRMTVSVDGRTRWTWPVSTGAPGYLTPTGSYSVLRTERHYFSKEWDDVPMPHSIFFTKRGHAIHGSSQTKLLGRPVSHGCVRLNPANASQLFQLVQSRGLNATTVTVK